MKNQKLRKHKKIKTIRIKCFKPTNVKKDAILLTMRRARKTANYISQKIQENKLDTSKPGIKSVVDKLTYTDCHRYNIPTALIQTQRDKVIEAFNSWLSNNREGTPPHWGGIPPIRLDRRTLTIKKGNNKYIFFMSTSCGKVPLISNSQIKDHWVENSKSYELVWSHKHQTFFIHLHVDNGKCQFPAWKNIKHILAFDINFNRIALSVMNLASEIKLVKFFHLGNLNAKHKHYLELRKKLQNKKRCNSVIKRLRGKESNYSRDFCHKISALIVKIAKMFPGCAIFSENLKNVTKDNKKSKQFNRRLHQMTIRLRNFVEYKANNLDIRTSLSIYPYGTSRSCSHCGSFDTRRSGRYLKCKCCGYLVDADFNATVNCCKRALKYIFKAAGRCESVPLTGRLNAATHSGIQVPLRGTEFVGNDSVLFVKEQSL